MGGGVRAARSGAPERSRGPFEKKYRNVVRDCRETPTFVVSRATFRAKQVRGSSGILWLRSSDCSRKEFRFLRTRDVSPLLAGARASTHNAPRTPAPAHKVRIAVVRARARAGRRAYPPSLARSETRRGFVRLRISAHPPFLHPPSQPPQLSDGVRRRGQRPRRPGGHAEHGTREMVPLGSGSSPARYRRESSRDARRPRGTHVDSTHSGQVSANWRDS